MNATFTAKTTCPISLAQFNAEATHQTLSICGLTVYANPMAFSSGSFGWNKSDKLDMQIPDGANRGNWDSVVEPLTVVLPGGRGTQAKAKAFSSGSVGWNATEKFDMKFGDKVVTVQCGINITLVKSKEAADDFDFGTVDKKAKAQLGVNMTIVGSKEAPRED